MSAQEKQSEIDIFTPVDLQAIERAKHIENIDPEIRGYRKNLLAAVGNLMRLNLKKTGSTVLPNSNYIKKNGKVLKLQNKINESIDEAFNKI